MRPTRRATEYQRAQSAGRTAAPFIHIEAPVGGWNTRDSEDNIDPVDALTFDNWWPDIGEVRTRPGYTLHCDIGNAVTGSDLVLNGGFETAGAGGLDVFANWTEGVGLNNAELEQSTDLVQAGTYACKFWLDPRFAMANPATIEISQTISVSAEAWYRLQFYSTQTEDVYSIGNSLSYKIYDEDNSANIVDWTETEVTGSELTLTSVLFETPAGCTSITVYFKNGNIGVSASNPAENTAAYLDAVTLYAVSGSVTHVETLAEYIKGADRDLIAASGENLYDVTTSTPSLINEAATTYDNARWQWANFDGKLIMVNGVDKVQWTSGATVTDLSITYDDGGGADEIDPIGVNVFKNRTWFWLASSQDVYYSALNAAGGLCSKFPLSRVGQFGGNLMLMETWTRDGGSGPDDFAVFVMSSGEAIIYQGSYPGAAGDWALVGIYNIGEPMGYRSAVKFGGDLYIITKLDIVRMSEVLQGIEARQMETKISKAHRLAVKLYEDNWGWEATVYPANHMAIFNVPVTENPDPITTADEDTNQHVQNTITGAWARFKQIPANTWQTFDGGLYFGAHQGRIYQFGDTEDDSDAAIESTFQTAWLPLGGLGGNKLFKLVREAYKTNTNINVSNYFAVDFRQYNSQAFPDAIATSGPEWDAVLWDAVPWSSEDRIYYEWNSIGEYGERVGLRKRLSTKQKVTYLGSSWVVESGDRL